jgi:hypothetical protein
MPLSTAFLYFMIDAGSVQTVQGEEQEHRAHHPRALRGPTRCCPQDSCHVSQADLQFTLKINVLRSRIIVRLRLLSYISAGHQNVKI